ncbi:MAG: zinc metalloprotease HtpX [Bryobacterales bacterium]|nr:zinc metalloprotease HtpX [Bryobacterales bacterium]
MNRIRTLILLSTLTALLLWAGQALGGQNGLMFALVLAGLMNFGAYWFSDKIVLRMYRAREISPAESAGLYAMVRELAMRADLPMPRIYLIPEEAPNAFATGRDPQHGVVAVTEGLQRMLNRDEVAGVIAHELAHIKHRDTLVMCVAATLAGALSMLANAAMWGSLFGGGRSHGDEEPGSHPLSGLLGIIVAPLAATLIQMAISRGREFVADETAARITGNPLALSTALRKIESWSGRLPMDSASPSTAHLFIQNPFAGGGLLRLFSTHPPTQARVDRLEAMASRGYAVAV